MEYIRKLAQQWDLTVDRDFKFLLPRDSETARKLEAKILAEGCRDPLVVWRKTNAIVDGNTRYEICRKHNICFAVQYMDFESKGEAMRWEYENQDSRRNMTHGQKIAAAMRVEEVEKAEAGARMRAGVKVDPMKNFAEGGKGLSRDALGAMAGVSGVTYEKGAEVFRRGPEELKEIYRKGGISTDAAHKITNMEEAEQREVLKEIGKGAKPAEAIRNVIEKREGNRRGWTKEDRENRAKTFEIIETMKSNEGCEYTLDMLVEDIQINSTAYFDTMNAILEQHNDLINDNSRPQVCGMIQKYVIGKANDLLIYMKIPEVHEYDVTGVDNMAVNNRISPTSTDWRIFTDVQSLDSANKVKVLNLICKLIEHERVEKGGESNAESDTEGLGNNR